MPFTQFLLTLVLTLLGLVLSIFAAAYGERREETYLVTSILGSLVVVPIAVVGLYLALLPYVTMMDWWHIGTFRGLLFDPIIVMVVATWLGWFLGRFAGKYWAEDNDSSCLQCILVPFVLLLVGSIIVTLLP